MHIRVRVHKKRVAAATVFLMGCVLYKGGEAGKQQCNQREEQKENKDPSQSEYGTNMFDTHTSSLSFQADLEGSQVHFGHLSLCALGQPRLIFDEYVLMLDHRGAAWVCARQQLCFKLGRRCGPHLSLCTLAFHLVYWPIYAAHADLSAASQWQVWDGELARCPH